MLTFDLPCIDPSISRTVDTQPKAVAAWLERLPFASPMVSAQQLVTALCALNRSPLDETVRYTLMQLYRPVVARVCGEMETLLAGFGVPPRAQQRQFGALLRELQIEHSIGYKHLLLAQIQQRSGSVNARLLAEIAAQLMGALRDIQTACQLTRTLTTPGLWQEMHALYAYAQTARLADSATNNAPALSLAYRQAVLMALADPSRMRHAEIIFTRHLLGRFGGLAQLCDAPIDGGRGFAIPSMGDTTPCHYVQSPGSASVWLDTEVLCFQLREIVNDLRHGASLQRVGLTLDMEIEFSRDTCIRLFKQWRGGAVRTYKRYPTPGRTVQTVAGVGSIHRLLEQTAQANQPEFPDSSFRSFEVAERTSDATLDASTAHWISDNDSAVGLALNGTPDAPLGLQVGDALAVRVGGVADWSLGVIRWGRMRDASQVELGVERLAPRMEPAWVRPMRGGKLAEPALFVPGLAALRQNDRLLLPHHLYQPGMDAEVHHGDHCYLLTFGRRFKHTPNFDLIDFTIFADLSE